MVPLRIQLPFLLSLSFLFLSARASVPSAARFKYVVEEMSSAGSGDVEHDAHFTFVDKFHKAPLLLCFYNTTPNAFTFAIALGGWGAGEKRWTAMRWIWEANRGHLVSEKASLMLGKNGNLVLSEANGKVVWQTNTANKGVVGMKLLPTGNLVLHDSKVKFVWQSFEYPTDTIMVGQPLRLGKKLVSWASRQNSTDGAYTLALETRGMAMYYKSPKTATPLLYYKQLFNSSHTSVMQYIALFSQPPSRDFDSQLGFDLFDSDVFTTGALMTFSFPKYNSTHTFLRLGMHGNVRFYTYYDMVMFPTWEVTYHLFSKEPTFDEPSTDYYLESECQLPEKCGDFGLCENNQCVACPTAGGLMGWSEDCAPPKPGCKDFHYYKLQRVDHFLTKYSEGDGPMKEDACSKKCSDDCECLGYFYHTDTSKCWIAYDLKTLNRVAISKDAATHLACIKVPNQ